MKHDVGLPIVIINDGRVLEHNLRQRGLDDIWLDRQLKAHHVKRSQDIQQHKVISVHLDQHIETDYADDQKGDKHYVQPGRKQPFTIIFHIFSVKQTEYPQKKHA